MASSPKWYDRVMDTSTTTGTGTYTLSGTPVTGHQAFSVVGNGNSCYYCAQEVDASGNPSGGWEVGVGTYTTSGLTLSRDKILASSNSGSAVSWSAGTRRIFLCQPAAIAEPVLDMGGRLTTESGVPVSTSDRTSQGTLYYTPFAHNRVSLWDGSGWRRSTFTERSLSLTLTSGKNYDVFLYDNSGTLTLELSAAWTNDTTPADTLTTQDGVAVKSGATTRRWLGTIRASGTNVTEDSAGGSTTQVGGKRFVWNAYNQVRRDIKVKDTTDDWVYKTNTVRQANAAAGNKVEYVCGEASLYVTAAIHQSVALSGSNAGTRARVGLGIDSITVFSGWSQGGYYGSTDYCISAIGARYTGYPGTGYHYVAALEAGAPGTDCRFTGDNGGDMQSGLTVEILG